MEMLKDKIDKLEYAKKAVLYCLDNENGSVDFHGLSYWAGVVEKLREEIKGML